MDILIETPTPSSVEEQSSQLDASQYTREGILKYEKIYGRAFVSTGGPCTSSRGCR